MPDHIHAVIFLHEKTGGASPSPTFYDAQVGMALKLSDYLSRAKPSKTSISRVDNLIPNDGVLKNAVKIKGK